MTLTDEDMDELIATLAVITPAKPDAALIRGWELVFAGQDVSLLEVQQAMVTVIQGGEVWCSASQALAQVRVLRKARLDEADKARGGQPGIHVGEPVYWPGHPRAGEWIDPDDKADYRQALALRSYTAARPTDKDHSSDMARLLPGWRPTQQAIGDGR